MIVLNKYVGDRTYKDMAVELVERMKHSSPFNTVLHTRFSHQQVLDYVLYSPEYQTLSGGVDYLYKSYKHRMKAQIVKYLIKMGASRKAGMFKILNLDAI